MREWPKYTKVQRDLLVRLEQVPQQSLQYPLNRTYFRLLYDGMVHGKTIISNWCTLTQRGRDYVRFVEYGT